jgi:hypothetical protein
MCRATHPCRIIIVHTLSSTLHSILGVGYDVDQEELSRSFGVNIREEEGPLT